MKQYDFDKARQADISWNVAERHFRLMLDEMQEMGLYGEALRDVYCNLVANLGLMAVTNCSEYTHESIDAAAMIASNIQRSVGHLLLDHCEENTTPMHEDESLDELSEAIREMIAENHYDIAEPIGDDCLLVGESYSDGSRTVGVFRADGTELIPVDYFSIEWLPRLGMFDAFGDGTRVFDADGKELFSEYDFKSPSDDSDFVPVSRDGRHGVIHVSGEVVVPLEYDRALPGDADLPDLFCLVRDSEEEYVDARQIWTRRHIEEILSEETGATVDIETFMRRFGQTFHLLLAYCVLLLHSKSIDPGNPGWKAKIAAWRDIVTRVASRIACYTIAEGNSTRIRYRALMQELCDHEMLYGDHEDHVDWAKALIVKEGIGMTYKTFSRQDEVMSERVWEELAMLIASADIKGIEKFVNEL